MLWLSFLLMWSLFSVEGRRGYTGSGLGLVRVLQRLSNKKRPTKQGNKLYNSLHIILNMETDASSSAASASDQLAPYGHAPFSKAKFAAVFVFIYPHVCLFSFIGANVWVGLFKREHEEVGKAEDEPGGGPRRFYSWSSASSGMWIWYFDGSTSRWDAVPLPLCSDSRRRLSSLRSFSCFHSLFTQSWMIWRGRGLSSRNVSSSAWGGTDEGTAQSRRNGARCCN